LFLPCLVIKFLTFSKKYEKCKRNELFFQKKLEVQTYANVISYFNQEKFENPEVLLTDELRELVPFLREILMGKSQKLPQVKSYSS